MKILIIGKGGREHAIAHTIKKFDDTVQIFCAPGNGGTATIAKNINISELDIKSVKEFAVSKKIDFVIVTPDNPLAEGMIDHLKSAKISCFGPSKKAAQIESSKVFAKNLMKKYNIATANFKTFNDPKKAIDFIKSNNQFPIVIKTDGLAYGKGVFISQNLEQATTTIENIMIKKQFNDSGNEIVVEEFLEGTETSILCLTDGNVVRPLISCMDHKKAFDGDAGPNTGGMGAIAPPPSYDKKTEDLCMNEIFMPTIEALKHENKPFCGCLYFGLMLTKTGPKVVEYNCRFGDPETQAILPLLQTNLLEILIATSTGSLHEIQPKFTENSATACLVLTSNGYPDKFQTGFEITGLTEHGQLKSSEFEDVFVFHSGTTLQNTRFITNSGRVLNIVAKKNSLQNAIDTAYDAAATINFENKFQRNDIGLKALEIITK